MRRMADLLTKAADALDHGEDPFGLHFLNEHEVESGECLDMADYLALGARLAAWVIENPKRAGVAFEGAVNSMGMAAIVETLQRMNAKARTP